MNVFCTRKQGVWNECNHFSFRALQQPFFMTWTTDTSGSINYCTVFVENDCILLKKPLHSENLQLSLLWARVTEWRSGSRWKPVGKTDRTILEDTEGALLGCEPRQAGRQKDRARILKCASIVFQDILSSPLRNGTAGKACSRLWWGWGEGGWRNVAMWCQMIFPQKGSNSLWVDSSPPLSVREASESNLNVLQHSNAQRCQQTGGVGNGRVCSPPEAVGFAPSSLSIRDRQAFICIDLKKKKNNNSYFHLPLHLHCCLIISNVRTHYC